MLDYRDYMRRPERRPMRSATEILIAINVVVFLVQICLPARVGEAWMAYGALSTAGLAHGFVWQLITYQFMHGGLLHILFNCITIYFFGRVMEDVLGARRMLLLYFSSGVVGGLVQVGLGFIFGGRFGAPVVGASAAAFGLVAAFARLFPEQMTVLLVFPMRAKNLLYVSIAVALIGLALSSPLDPIAHAAHLGGILAGVLFVHFVVGGPVRLEDVYGQAGMQEPEDQYGLFRPREEKESESASEELPAGEYLEREVDPILDKISAHGIQSLTARERKILEAARQRMGKR